MADYYSILTIAPSATAAEIQAAIESQYNQVRRLTTHHDPQIVNQANQALLVLEQARATLLDPEKRAIYDAALGVGGAVGGVADLSEAGQQAPVNAPPVLQRAAYPNQAPAPAAARPPANAWICPECQHPNAVGTLFCQNCAKPVGRVCPNCQTTYDARAKFCPSCGISYDVAKRRIELNGVLTRKRMDRSGLASQAATTTSPDVQYLEYLSIGGGGWALFLGLTALLFLVATLLRLILSLLTPETLAQAGIISIINIFSGLVGLLRWAILLGAAFWLYNTLRRKGGSLNIPALVGFGLLGLMALAFGGDSFHVQRYFGGLTWLGFPLFVAVLLIGGGAFLMRYQTRMFYPAATNLPALRPVEQYSFWLQQRYQGGIIPVAGAGAALGLVAMFMVSSDSILSLVGGILALAAAAVLGVTALRAWNLVDGERQKFLAAQYSLKVSLAQLDVEIQTMEKELNSMNQR